MSKTSRVAIIGAGIGGLASAILLARSGYEVHMYEQQDQAGGRAGIKEQNGFRFDTGPSWYLMKDVFERFYELIGEDIDAHITLQRLQPAYKVFFEQTDPIEIYSDIERDRQTFERIEPGAGAALERYIKRSEHMYKLSLRHFLYTDFRQPWKLLHPAIIGRGLSLARMSLRSIDKYVSSYVKDQRLKQILEYPMVFLGTSPFQAPALFSLMSALDFKEGVFYPEGGIYSLIRSLESIAKKHGVQLHVQTPVKRINTIAGRAHSITLADDTEHQADIVLSNADLAFTETELLEPTAQSYPNSYWERKQPSPSALLMYLGIKGSLPELTHHNLLFVDDWQANFEAIFKDKVPPSSASLYICKPSHTDHTVAPAGHENVFVLVPLPAGVSLSQDEQTMLIDRYLSQIKKQTGVDLMKNCVTKAFFGPNDFADTFQAWQSTMLGPSHILRQSAFFRTGNKSKKLDNLYYVGAGTMPGIGLPMCLISAELTAQRIQSDHDGEIQSKRRSRS